MQRLVTAIEQLPLSQSLPRVLSAANVIDATDLASWLRLELMGYLDGNPDLTEDVVVPEYRTVVGSWHDIYGQMFLVEQPDLQFINEFRLRNGVAELEGLATATTHLTMPGLSQAEIIQNQLHVPVTMFRFDARSVSQVLANIRVQLLDRIAAYRQQLDKIPQAEVVPKREILKLQPGMFGVAIDLKAAWRRVFRGKG